MGTWQAGAWTITRVADPGFELILPQDDATRSTLQQSPWLQPLFVTDDWSLRIGSSALLLTGPGPTVLVDPWLAFAGDSEARRAALGTTPDIIVNSHVDGPGENAAFPDARRLLPPEEITEPGWEEATPGPLADGLEIVDLPGHNPGHIGVRVGDEALIVGHLFLHPAQVANPTSVLGDHDPAVLRATRQAVLEEAAANGTLLIGPIWAAPGAGRVHRDGGRWALAATTG